MPSKKIKMPAKKSTTKAKKPVKSLAKKGAKPVSANPFV
jgi:hypothetical protein